MKKGLSDHPQVAAVLKRQNENLNEDGHTDVASAIRQCKTMIEDAMQISSKLQTMNPEESLPSWWTNKLAIASNNMNKLRDYFLVPTTEAYKPVKSNHYDVKIQGVKKKDVNAILKYIKVDGGNYDIEDVDADQVTGGGMSSTSDGDIFIQGDDAGKLGMEIAKKFRGVKVMGEGVELNEKGII